MNYNPNNLVWHKVDEIPGYNRVFLYRSNLKTFNIDRGVEASKWENFCLIHDLKDWVYITDILPSWIIDELLNIKIE